VLSVDTPAYDIEAARRSVPALERLLPMAHCSHSPETVTTRAAADAYLDSWNGRVMDWDAWMIEIEGARAAFARLIGAAPDEVAVCASVSDATAGLASAIDWSAGRDGVVISGAEFPTVGHVWLAQRRHGARPMTVPVREGAIDAAAYDAVIDGRTRIVSACHAYYLNGHIQDVAAIAHRAHDAGAWIYVDAYQSLGTRTIDVKAMDIDFLASGTHKYLFGVPGIAFLYVRRELVERLEPTVTGWFGRREPFAFDADRLDYAPTAARFETGTPPVPAAYIARAGMRLIEEAGTDAIGEWTAALSRRLIEDGRARGLVPHGRTDPACKTPSTAFVCDDAHAIETRMRSAGVIASARGPVIRIAPHYYNTYADVDRALDALVDALPRG